jgi:phosphate transport system substrate-binding protein
MSLSVKCRSNATWVPAAFCAAVLALCSGGCGENTESTTTTSKLSGNIAIDGSSTVYPVTEAVAESFGKVHPDVKVTVGVSGTGGGFKRFSVGETDISDASRPIKASENETAEKEGVKYIEVPVCYDGLTVVVHPENDWADELTVDQLKQIYLSGGPQKWNEIDESFPDQPIKIYSPGSDSGTFDYFREAIVGKDNEFRADMSVSEDDHILVTGVAGDKYAIGYFGCAYYFENEDKLKAVAVVNPDTGEAVLPEPKTIEEGTYAPLSRPLFIYVNVEALKRPEVKAFVDYYLENAPELSEEVGYVRLPEEVYEKAAANVEDEKTGTFFLDDEGESKKGSVVDIYK